MRLALACIVVPAFAAANPRWQPDHSAEEMSSTDAEAYCAKRGKDWRLPTKIELQKTSAKLPADGFLWSGEDVSAERVGQRWIMNLSNRHIFNGDGRTGLAKCVKGPLPKRIEKKLGPAYATLGKPDAKLTVVVAVQHDYPWWKIRPTLDQLVTTRSVRFDLRPYIVNDRYDAAAIAVCVAARANKLVELEAKLRDIKPGTTLDAAMVRAMAIEAGVDGKRYATVAKPCAKTVAADREALEQRGIEAVPTFFVGATKVVGARPDELTAAIEAALQ